MIEGSSMQSYKNFMSSFHCVCAEEGLISLTELDPLGLHLPHFARKSAMARHLGYRAPGHNQIVQVALIAETVR